MRRSRFNRLTAVFAIFALLFATSAYLAHGYNADSQGLPHKSTHCDLCLQFQGNSAAAPSASTLVHTSELVLRLPHVADTDAVAWQRKARAHQPRAPPLLKAI